MKKRRIKRWINVEPYQYLALQKYLNQMEKKGWKLVSVFGSSSCRLTFEKNEDTDTEYYIVDYTKDYSALTPETETEKAKRYRGFIEEFGYEYVGSNGALQIYRTNSDQVVLRENNEEDMKILQKSVWKSFGFNLLLFFSFMFNFIILYRNGKNSLYTSNVSIFGQVFIGLFCLTLIFSEIIPFLYWYCRRKPLQSSSWMLISSCFRSFILLITIIILLGFMTSFYLVLYIGISVIFVVCLYSLMRYIHRANGKYLVYISMIVLILLFLNITTRLSFLSIPEPNADMSDKTEEINKIFNEANDTKLELTTYERNSILSNNLSISITYPDDNYVYIDRYKIQDGILKDWIKNQYEKDEYRQIMCPGIKEGTKQNGKWIYEGDESILIVDEYTYIAVDKNFILDDAGWKKINQLIEL